MSENVVARVRFPELYDKQKIFGNWDVQYPDAQVLVAPSGTKIGKSFGSALWLAKRALMNPNSYNVWIGPTYLKSKIGFRYMRAFLPQINGIKAIEGNLEIKISNGSYIKFLHGQDAETTVEGEAIDNFVIDESGKQQKQLWYSLLTTLTQTKGKGIVTGTPKGSNWYHEIFRRAKQGDPFYCWAHLKTSDSPYVSAEAIANAKRILPKPLFDQYYEAQFISSGSVFGDLSGIWDESLALPTNEKFWIHPDPAARAEDTVTGWDMAKMEDYSVFYTVNTSGKLVGYARFRRVQYDAQVDRLKHYLHTYMTGDRVLRYDATGVGSAVAEMIVEKDIDASITGVVFSQKSKQEMVSRMAMAIEKGWHRAPRIEQLEHELSSYELKVTKSGLFSYSAPDGEHDDIVSSAMLAISGAYQLAATSDSERYLEKLAMGEDMSDDDDEIMDGAAKEFMDEGEDDFFDDDTDIDDSDLDEY